MKVIKFLSRFTFICNIAFLIFAIANIIENAKGSSQTQAIPDIPILKEVIIILGLSAIFINTIMCLIYLILLIRGKWANHPKWLSIANFIFLLLQFYFFFLLKTN